MYGKQTETSEGKKVRSHQYISLHQLHIYKATKYSHVNYFVT